MEALNRVIPPFLDIENRAGTGRTDPIRRGGFYWREVQNLLFRGRGFRDVDGVSANTA